MKRIAVLPTMLTLGNAVCGFAAIAHAAKIDRLANPTEISWYLLVSGSFILLAMVFDVLDGYVARLSKSDSQFGGQLDSLCDAISFGLAPAFLLLRLGQIDWDEKDIVRQFLVVVAALYLVCAILRLARFNLENLVETPSNKRFKGLPSPGAAGCLAALVIFRSQLSAMNIGLDEPVLRWLLKVWTPWGSLLVALLMVSRFPYPHLTKNMLRGRRNFAFLVQAVLVVAVIFLSPVLTIFLLFWIYAIHTPIKSLLLWGYPRGKKLPSSEPTHTLS